MSDHRDSYRGVKRKREDDDYQRRGRDRSRSPPRYRRRSPSRSPNRDHDRRSNYKRSKYESNQHNGHTQPSKSKEPREMTMEEMNQYRAAAGLAPILVEEDDKKKELEEAAKRQALSEQIEKTEDIQEKLKLLKQQRAEREKRRQFKSLGDDDESEMDSTAWVEKNRVAVEEKKKAQALARMMEEVEQETDLGGLKVKHNADDFVEGKTILVLDDVQLVNRHGTEDYEDQLINPNMVENEKYKANTEARKPKSRYKDIDTLNFDKNGDPIKPEEEKGFTLSSTGKSNFEEEKARKAQVARELEAQLGTAYNVNDIARQETADFMSAEEALAQLRPKKKKKVTKARKRNVLADLADQVDDTQMQTDLVDAADRDMRKIRQDAQRRTDMKGQMAKYNETTAQAERDARIMFEDEDATLKSRPTGPVVAKLSAEDLARKMEVQRATAKEEVEGQLFAATSEYVKSIHDGEYELDKDALTILREKAREKEASVVAEPVKEDEDEDEMKTDTPQISPPQETFVLDGESGPNKGMAGMMAYLRKTGMTDEATRMVASRQKDAMTDGGVQKTVTGSGEEYNFNRRDEYGREMSLKEQARQLSYVFHNKGPGKNKLDKRHKKAMQEIQRQKNLTTESAIESAKTIDNALKQRQSAFLVMTGSQVVKQNLEKE